MRSKLSKHNSRRNAHPTKRYENLKQFIGRLTKKQGSGKFVTEQELTNMLDDKEGYLRN